MKKLLVGFLVLSSFSSFAENCKVYIEKDYRGSMDYYVQEVEQTGNEIVSTELSANIKISLERSEKVSGILGLPGKGTQTTVEFVGRNNDDEIVGSKRYSRSHVAQGSNTLVITQVSDKQYQRIKGRAIRKILKNVRCD